MGGFVLTIVFLYRKRQVVYLKDLERIKSDYEKSLLRAQLEIQEQAFQAISRDIHDNINLSLTLAKLNLNTMKLDNPAAMEATILTTIELLSKSIDDLTHISRSMNPDVITDQGLITAVSQEIEKLKKLHWYTIEFEVTGSPLFMDAQKELFIFRIIQESFNNILKHSQAKNIKLRLHYEIQNNLHIKITDDGVGFLREPGSDQKSVTPGAGLRNMKRRAELLSGSCSVESQPGKGTNIHIKIPINHEQPGSKN
jgi:signal transduction histidine kinase